MVSLTLSTNEQELNWVNLTSFSNRQSPSSILSSAQMYNKLLFLSIVLCKLKVWKSSTFWVYLKAIVDKLVYHTNICCLNLDYLLFIARLRRKLFGLWVQYFLWHCDCCSAKVPAYSQPHACNSSMLLHIWSTVSRRRVYFRAHLSVCLSVRR